MNEDVKAKSSVGIIGAGIQGICTGLYLIKKNFNVTLIDREDLTKNSAASYGNAGHFSPYASVPINRPDILVDVPSMLFSSTGPLALKWNYVPKMIPWFLKFIKNCSEKKMRHTAKYMHQILDLALPAYDELLKDIDTSALIENKGIIYFWTDKDLKSRELEINLRKELGVEQQLLTPYEIHDLEPHIRQIYHAGVFYPGARHTRNPRKVLLKLFDLFLKLGGVFKKEDVEQINFSQEEKVLVRANTKSFTFDKIVITCGAFSKRFTDQAGEKIPLDTERGYHVHFKGYNHLLSRPIIFLNRGFGVTPMEQGLRVVGTVEFGGLKNPISKKRIINLANNAKYLFPEISEHYDEWLGFRPTLPDFLPVMGSSKKHKNLFYSFGHHHLGWTLGAISGKIIASMIAGENTNLDLSPYSSTRFS